MKHQWKPLLLVACIFLFTGSIICMNDVLFPALKEFFQLSYVEASYVQQSFFLVYLIFPIPIAYYISKVGYKTSLITALLISGFGGMLILPAFYYSSYVIALVAIFTVSIGVAVVNVAANPMAALLGDPSGAHVRVNIVQLFSRIGYLITPIFATSLIYGSANSISFHRPYVILGIGTFLFAVFILFSKLPSLKPTNPNGFSLISIVKESRKYPQLFWGAIIMFFYMGAETGTAGFFINYLNESTVVSFSVEKAARFLTYYYVATTVTGLGGIFLLQFVSPGKMVAISGTGMITLYLLISLTNTVWNPYYLICIGGFIAIMFPTIFSLGIEGLGTFTEKGSALINMAIVGGAVGPLLQGIAADLFGVRSSYLVPCIGAVLIVAYGIFCHRRSKRIPMESKV